MFALKIESDYMMPEFVAGDIIIINPNAKIINGDFVIVRIKNSNTAILRQFKRSKNKITFHPLNPKYNDISMDYTDDHVILGKVIEKVKKY